MPTTAYNSNLIHSWQNTAATLGQQIAQATHTIDADTRRLTALRGEERTITAQLHSNQINITWAEINYARGSGYPYHYSFYNPPYQHYYHYHSRLMHPIVDIGAMNYLHSLYNQRSTLHTSRNQICGEIDAMEARQIKNNRTLQQNKSQLTALEQQITHGSAFLHTLSTKPEVLVTRLKQAILTTFKAYDNAHPTARSPQVRICLYAIEQKLNMLTRAPELHTVTGLQGSYLDLCAMLYDMHNRIEQEGQDTRFKNLLTNLLATTHIAANGDLPDAMHTGQATTTRFALLAQQNELFSLTKQQLERLEEQGYEHSLQELKQGIFVGELDKKIQAVSKAVQSEVAAKKHAKQAVDYRFYTHVLNEVWHAVNHRQDAASLQHLVVLADAAAGRPTTSKKIAGALMVLAGTLLIATSIACLLATFGASSLASGFGVALGISVVQSQICLAVGAGATTLAGSGLTFWGINTFKAGMRQGLSKDLLDLQHEVQHSSTNNYNFLAPGVK